MKSRSNDSDFATSTSISPIHESDLLPDANRCTPPRVGGSDSGSLVCISRALAVKLFLGDDCFGGSGTPLIGFARPPVRNIDLRFFQNPPFLCFPDFDLIIFASAAAVAISAGDFIDRCRFLNRRLRSFFDLTLPIQETFGDDGSAIGTADFPVGSVRFRNSRVFDARQFRRIFASV